MQEMVGEQGAAYIPTHKDRGFTPNLYNAPKAPVLTITLRSRSNFYV